MKISAALTVRTVVESSCVAVVVPVMLIVSSSSSRPSSVGVSVKRPVAKLSSAGIVIVKGCGVAEKSEASVVPAATDTDTATGLVSGAPSVVACTSISVAPSPSTTRGRSTVSSTRAAGLSVSVTGTVKMIWSRRS